MQLSPMANRWAAAAAGIASLWGCNFALGMHFLNFFSEMNNTSLQFPCANPEPAQVLDLSRTRGTHVFCKFSSQDSTENSPDGPNAQTLRVPSLLRT